MKALRRLGHGSAKFPHAVDIDQPQVSGWIAALADVEKTRQRAGELSSERTPDRR
jgi:hypothetical protein